MGPITVVKFRSGSMLVEGWVKVSSVEGQVRKVRVRSESCELRDLRTWT